MLMKNESKVTMEEVILTPQMAQELLNLNPDNRPISTGRVAQYAHLIEEGLWDFNGVPIIIARDGYMNDGQHRCLAVIKAGKPIRTLIIRGVERVTRRSLDQGLVRTAGHLLSMDKVTNSNMVARTARMLRQIDVVGELDKNRTGISSNRDSRIETVLYGKEHLGEIVAAFAALPETASRVLMAPSSVVALFILFARKTSGDTAMEFMLPLITGTNLSADSPIHVARERLIRMKALSGMKPSERKIFEIVIRAWNAWRTGKSNFNSTGEWPEIAA